MLDWEEVIFFGDAGDILTLLEWEREAKRLQWPAYQCRFLIEFILPGGLYSISFYKMVKLVVLCCLWNKSLLWAFPLHVFKYLWNSYLHSYWHAPKSLVGPTWGSNYVELRKVGTWGPLPTSSIRKGVEGCARSPGIRLGRGTRLSSLNLHPNQPQNG